MQRAELELDDFLPYRLSITSNAVSLVIAQSYEERFDLKMHEWRVIAVLAQDGGLTQQQIVGRTKMDKVTVSRAAQVLEQRKLLRREPNVEDGRALCLSLTAEGKRLHSRVGPVALELEQQILSGLHPDEIEDLKRALRKLEAAAEKLLAMRLMGARWALARCVASVWLARWRSPREMRKLTAHDHACQLSFIRYYLALFVRGGENDEHRDRQPLGPGWF